MKLDVLEKLDPASGKSEFVCHLEWLRGLLINMQEKSVGDRFGDDVEYHLPTEIQWLTNLIEVSKREREFLETTKKSDVENWSQADKKVWKLICDLVQLICHPNDSCYPNVKTVTHEFREIFRKEFDEPKTDEKVDEQCETEGDISLYQSPDKEYLEIIEDGVPLLDSLAKYSSKAIKDLQGRIVKLKPIEYDSFTNLFGLPNTHIVCEIWYQGQFYHKYTVMRKNTLEEKIFCDDNGRIIVFDSLTDILCHVNSYWYSKGFVRIK